MLSFASEQTWEMLNYHLPPLVATLTLTVLTLWLVAGGVKNLAARRRPATPCGGGGGGGREERVIFSLFLLALTLASIAAVAGLYPLGAVRHSIYLGPIAFITAGCAISALGRTLFAFMRPRLAGAGPAHRGCRRNRLCSVAGQSLSVSRPVAP